MGRRITDYTGQRRGILTVVGVAGRNAKGGVTFTCQCDCGNRRVLPGSDLGKRNHPKSCGCMRTKWRCIAGRTEKRCPRCKVTKPLDQFVVQPSTNDGYSPYCQPCQRSYNQSKPRRSKDKVNAYARHYSRTNLNHRIGKRARSRIARALRGKRLRLTHSKLDLIGCSIPELRTHLERQFRSGMSWANYGHRGWHMDHIKPCASFDLTDPKQRAICFHYTNLQPLWAVDNLRKSDKP